MTCSCMVIFSMTTPIGSSGKQNKEVIWMKSLRQSGYMWYSKKLQNRVRFQIAAVRISISELATKGILGGELPRAEWYEILQGA